MASRPVALALALVLTLPIALTVAVAVAVAVAVSLALAVALALTRDARTTIGREATSPPRRSGSTAARRAARAPGQG